MSFREMSTASNLEKISHIGLDENEWIDFVDVDNDVETTEVSSDEDIIAMVRPTEAEDEDDEENEEDVDECKPPTLSSAKEASEHLRKYLMSVPNSETVLQDLCNIKAFMDLMSIKAKKQTTIADFFLAN
jgi:hypothetical protein